MRFRGADLTGTGHDAGMPHGELAGKTSRRRQTPHQRKVANAASQSRHRRRDRYGWTLLSGLEASPDFVGAAERTGLLRRTLPRRRVRSTARRSSTPPPSCSKPGRPGIAPHSNDLSSDDAVGGRRRAHLTRIMTGTNQQIFARAFPGTRYQDPEIAEPIAAIAARIRQGHRRPRSFGSAAAAHARSHRKRCPPRPTLRASGRSGALHYRLTQRGSAHGVILVANRRVSNNCYGMKLAIPGESAKACNRRSAAGAPGTAKRQVLPDCVEKVARYRRALRSEQHCYFLLRMCCVHFLQ
jgi:hypothetical protein